MTRRYFFLVNVRPHGALGDFDPVALSVDWYNDATAVYAAIDKASALGWETCGLKLIRVEDV